MTKLTLPTYHHELIKAFLFFRTCTVAIANTNAHIKSTESYIQWNSVNGYYNEHEANEAELEVQQRELELWEDRWAEAGVGMINWVVTRSLGRGLPAEILGLVEVELRRGELDLPSLR